MLPAEDGGASDAADAGVDPDPCRPDALCPNDLFRQGASGTDGPFDLRTRINVIRGRSASDIWAAGAEGALAHFDGTAWLRSEGGTREALRGLWLRDEGEMALITPGSSLVRGVAVDGAEGAIPSADGWLRGRDAALPSNTGVNMSSAWAPPGAQWIWGTTEEILGTPDSRSRNGIWRARVVPEIRAIEVRPVLPAGTCETIGCLQMMAVHGASPDDLWIVGGRGVTLHVTDAQGDAPTITPVDSRTWATLNGVWAAGPTNAFAVGGVGTIRRYAGSELGWEIVSNVPATENLHAVWGTSSSDVWAVGDASCVLHFDGTRWSRVEVGGLGGRRPDLYTVWTAEPGHVWIGGNGVILSPGGKP